MPDSLQNQEIRLVRRPRGRIDPDDFSLADTPVRQPEAGEVLVKVRWLSMDTYLHERASGDAMGPMVPLGARMVGRGLGTVVAGALPAGILVRGEFGWQRYATVPASEVAPAAPIDAPETWHLSVLGVPGLTAWIGLHHCLLQKNPDGGGKTLLVSSAAGTVGSLVGQLALEAGLRVAGIAGGPEKCARLRALGFHAAIDRREVGDWAEALRQALPEGIDFYFDNAGGEILEAAAQCAKTRGRLLLCGHSGEYQGRAGRIPSAQILYKRLCIEGFLVWDHAADFGRAGQALAQAVRKGGLQLDETIHHGLASAPAALPAMMDGRGVGKHLVRLED